MAKTINKTPFYWNICDIKGTTYIGNLHSTQYNFTTLQLYVMKKEIHPNYHTGTKVVCICGHEHTLNAAVAWPIKVESCPNCHPTYTGKEQKVVVKGRMEKFLEKQKRMKAAQKKAA